MTLRSILPVRFYWGKSLLDLLSHEPGARVVLFSFREGQHSIPVSIWIYDRTLLSIASDESSEVLRFHKVENAAMVILHSP